MKFLQAVTLSAIFVGCVTGSWRHGRLSAMNRTPPKKRAIGKFPFMNFAPDIYVTREESMEQSFSETLDKEELDAIAEFCAKGSQLCEQEVDKIFEAQDPEPELIADVINKTGQTNTRTLRKLCRKSAEIVGKVLEKVNFPQEALSSMASSHKMMCNPEKFIVLLNKIDAAGDQESVVTNGIERLPALKDSKCLPFLLDAMKGKTFKNEHLEEIAVQKASEKIAKRKHDEFVELQRLSDLPETTPDFLADFINQTNQANENTLRVLCNKRSETTIGNVLEKVNFPQEALISMASSQELTCNPEKFIVLLNKIDAPEKQKFVVESGVENLLVYTHRKCIPPLLIAMRDKPFKNVHLEDIAVKKAFERVVETDGYEPGVLWCTFGHPAITSKVYGDGLFATAKDYMQSRTFKWLLEKADNEDLKVLQAKAGYTGLRADLRASVEQAKLETMDGRTRLNVTLPKNKPEIASTPASKPEIVSTPASTSTNRWGFSNFHAYMTGGDEIERSFGFPTFGI